MKILVLAPFPFSQNSFHSLALQLRLETLATDGHQLTVIVYPEGDDVAIDNCRLIRLPKLPFINTGKNRLSWKKLVRYRQMARAARELLEKEKFGLIHACREGVFVARNIYKRYRIPYVYQMDWSLPRPPVAGSPLISALLPMLKRREKLAVQESAGVLVNCPYFEDRARSYDENVLIQRLENPSLLTAEAALKLVRKDLKLKTDSFVLVYVGSLKEDQGIDLLLSGFSLACLESQKMRLVIVGGEKKDIKQYKVKARSLAISNKVTFTGARPAEELASYLELADLLISPCIDGNAPPATLSSFLDSGKAVLATRHAVHTQILDDAVAWMVDIDESALAVGIGRLAGDPELRQHLADNARSRVAEAYTKKKFAKESHRFYARVRLRNSKNTKT